MTLDDTHDWITSVDSWTLLTDGGPKTKTVKCESENVKTQNMAMAYPFLYRAFFAAPRHALKYCGCSEQVRDRDSMISLLAGPNRGIV